ncbi:MAG TPA: hypothetical protein VLF41_02550 [Candidatus Nanoarchaeia archaeon]|nr:hypothetical protein [Candidatus Nanoarchaeia archaeon]
MNFIKLAEVTVSTDKNGAPSFGWGSEFLGGNVQDLVPKIINVLLFVVGAVSVIMIIVGGLMYTLSAGDPSNTKKAKDTILYAIIGLVVALAAGAIVAFARGQFK